MVTGPAWCSSINVRNCSLPSRFLVRPDGLPVRTARTASPKPTDSCLLLNLRLLHDTPRVLNDTPRVLNDTPRVLDDTPKVLKNSPRVLNDNPRLFGNNPGLLINKRPLFASEKAYFDFTLTSSHHPSQTPMYKGFEEREGK